MDFPFCWNKDILRIKEHFRLCKLKYYSQKSITNETRDKFINKNNNEKIYNSAFDTQNEKNNQEKIISIFLNFNKDVPQIIIILNNI